MTKIISLIVQIEVDDALDNAKLKPLLEEMEDIANHSSHVEGIYDTIIEED